MGTQNGDAHVHTKKLLFLTNSESGQANTVLAMALEAVNRPHVEVHVASFQALKGRVEKLDPRLNFHPLDGKSMSEMALIRELFVEPMPHLPTRKSFAAYCGDLGLAMVPWDGDSGFRSLCFGLWIVSDRVVFRSI